MADRRPGVLASYDHLDDTLDAIVELKNAGYREIRAFGPLPEHHIEDALGYGQSPVRVFTIVGALTGLAAGLAFTIFTAMEWPLIVGGKPLISIPAFVAVIFEMTVLFGVLATYIGLFINIRLPRAHSTVVYDPEFTSGRFGVYVKADPTRLDRARSILNEAGPAEVREDPEGVEHV